MSGNLETERRGRVLVLTIDNPEQRNALGPTIYGQGWGAVEDAAREKEVGAIVLTGTGGVFSSGGNLERLRSNREREPAVQRESTDALNAWVRAMRTCPQPIVAAVEGAAAGAGFSLALACDLIVAAEDAVFTMAYAKVGLNPDGGASVFLTRALPPHLARELVFFGDKLSAQHLHELGVVNKVVPKGQALDTAMEWAGRLADGPTSALGRAKRLLESAYESHFVTQLDLEASSFVDAVHHAEAGEGIAAFFDKRKPRFHKG